jgi:hypothetical protein
MVVWSAGRPRSVRSSSTFRYDSENRRYQPTAQVITAGSKWRHLNKGGLGFRIPAGYQGTPVSYPQLCNTTLYRVNGVGIRGVQMAGTRACQSFVFRSETSEQSERLPGLKLNGSAEVSTSRDFRLNRHPNFCQFFPLKPLSLVNTILQ